MATGRLGHERNLPRRSGWGEAEYENPVAAVYDRRWFVVPMVRCPVVSGLVVQLRFSFQRSSF